MPDDRPVTGTTASRRPAAPAPALHVRHGRLRLLEGEARPPELVWPRERTILAGRTAGADLRLGDAGASRRHFEIGLGRHGFTLTDLDSTHGTEIDGVRVRQAVLRGGERIRAGGILLGFDALERRVAAAPPAGDRLGHLIGRSPAMRRLFGLLAAAARTDSTVLLVGETGTGKDLAALTLHELSARSGGPFEAVNCAAIPETLAESQLFGHARGAFTGADRDHPGSFARAGGGTLFLDEVTELPLALQPKLLRVLERRLVRPVGGEREARVDLRLVAAAPAPLEQAVRAGRFRADLYHRLRVIELRLPALRERLDDLDLLAGAFLDELGPPGAPARLEPSARDALRAHSWPGNVRELRHALEAAVALGGGRPIAASDLRLSPLAAPAAGSLAAAERAHVERILDECAGNKREAARRLGIAPTTLYARLRSWRAAGR